MRVRLIPPRTKVPLTVIGKLSLKDLAVCLVFLATIFLVFTSKLPFIVRLIVASVLIIVMFVSMVRVTYYKGYEFLFSWVAYVFRKKKINTKKLKLAELVSLQIDDCVDVSGRLSAVIEVKGIDFDILSAHKQEAKISFLAEALKYIPNGSIVKLQKPIDFSDYINQNDKRLTRLEDLMQEGSEENLVRYASRIDILKNANVYLQYHQEMERVNAEAFYIIAYESSREQLNAAVNKCMQSLTQVGIAPVRLKERELEVFYRYFFDCKEDEEIRLPAIEERWNKIMINGEPKKILTVGEYPFFVLDGWGWEIFSIPNTKVVMNFSEAPKKNIYKNINKTITELQLRYGSRGTGETERQELSDRVAALQNLAEQLRHDREQLHQVSLYIMCSADQQGVVEETFKKSGLFVNDLFFKQLESYVNMLPYLSMDKANPPKEIKEMQTTTLASTFPFISRLFLDPEGVYLGVGRYPIFFDLFTGWKRLDRMRPNNSMTILGKPGGGKSYFMKKLLMQYACGNSRIFILDPENEYDHLCKKLNGNWIDVGGVRHGIINPMQVFPTLAPDDDEEEGEAEEGGELLQHRQFLDKFFRITMPDLDNECRPYLKKVIGEAYTKRKITDSTDFAKLSPEDFPLVQEVYEIILEKQKNKKLDEYEKLCYKKLENNFADFAKGGIHHRLWNGYTTLKFSNDFTVLNFQSLIANNNDTVANGQMLLIMRYLNQEIILNRESAGEEKNIIIAVDEAHLFINKDFPVALQFMAQTAKRVRKYKGSQIVATQNVNDFVGTTESMKQQATAVINNSQYSVIFGLNPEDVTQAADLYKSYNGGLTRSELDIIADAPQGKALFVIDSNTRFSAEIKVFAGEEDIIVKPKVA